MQPKIQSTQMTSHNNFKKKPGQDLVLSTQESCDFDQNTFDERSVNKTKDLMQIFNT